jgi:hypothetical protein
LPVRKLADILREHAGGYENKTIHFCKIDVEGFERSVLEGMDFNVHRPWIMLLESTVPGTSAPSHAEWEDLLIGNGYAFAHSYGINRYYVDTRLDSGISEKIKQGFDHSGLLVYAGFEVEDSKYIKLRFVRDFIRRIGRKEKTFSEYKQMRREMKEGGLNIPFYKEAEWFGKFVLLKRK